MRKLPPEIYFEVKAKVERWENNYELVFDAINIAQMSQNVDYYQEHHYPKSDIFIEDAGIQKYLVMEGIINNNNVTYTFYSLSQLEEFMDLCKRNVILYKPISNYKFSDLEFVLQYCTYVENQMCKTLHFKNRYPDGFNI